MRHVNPFVYKSLLLLFVGVLQAGLLYAQYVPTTAPQLRIEAGMHTSLIKSVEADRTGKYVITAGYDKVIRLWEGTTGKLLNTFRIPIETGDAGRFYTAAISPDASLVVGGGWMMPGNIPDVIYIFDRQTGNIVHRITDIPAVVQYIIFSPDGSMMYVSIASKKGLRAYRVSDWKLMWYDDLYFDSSYGLDATGAGYVATTCYDGYLRLYDSEGDLVEYTKFVEGAKPSRCSFSPDGKLLSVGFDDITKTFVYSVPDLKLAYTPANEVGEYSNLSETEWSTSGTMWASGTFSVQDDIGFRKQMLAYRYGRFDKADQYQLPNYNTVMTCNPHPLGGVLVGAADPGWGWIDESGEVRFWTPSPIADYRNIYDELAVSPSGLTVKYAYQYGAKIPALFRVDEQSIEIEPASFPNLLAPTKEGFEIASYDGEYNPTLNGESLGLDANELSRCIAVAPSGARFVLGSEWYIRCFDFKGKEVWKIDASGTCWSINISSNGQLVIAALGDGTVRWYRLSDGKELLCFFPHADRQRWVAYTPSGYYASSPGGEDLIGWHINRSDSENADFFPAGKFRDTYYRPDVVGQILTVLDEVEALRMADRSRGLTSPANRNVDISHQLPPVISIISPEEGTSLSQQEVVVRYNVRAPQDAPAQNIRALIDGRPYQPPREVANGITFRGIKPAGSEGTFTLILPQQDCDITILAENGYGTSEPATVHIKWTGQKEGFVIKPKLYVLAIGVSNYADADLKLNYPAKDATDFSNTLKKQVDLYREVEVKLLTDAMATKDGILNGLEWLERNTTSKDVAMLFVAGHGINDNNGNFYYLPQNANLESMKVTCLPFSDIMTTISNIPGKILVFLDACHSGNATGEGLKKRGLVDVNGVVNELASAENGAIVFSSSTGKQFSLESTEWGNGAFTKALVEGLNGGADYQKNGRVTINMLDLYLSERVKVLTKGQQSPTSTKPPNTTDFPIIVVAK